MARNTENVTNEKCTLQDLDYCEEKKKKKLSATWYLSSSHCSEGDRGVGKPGLVTDSG